MADLTLRLDKGSELTFRELDDNFLNLDSDIVDLRNDLDSAIAGVRAEFQARDSAVIESIVDSAYIEARTTHRDSAFVINIVDSAYVEARSSHRDSSFVTSIVDSTYVNSLVDTIDSSDIFNIVDSAWVNQRVDVSALVIDSTAPTDADSGDLWLDRNTDLVHIYDGSVWFEFPIGDGGERALDSAAVFAIIDSAYVQARQQDSLRDSGFITSVVNTLSLNELSDVNTPTPGNNTVLTWTGTEWEAVASAAGGDFDSAKAINLLDVKGVENVTPLTDSTYDLGSSSRKWKDLYVSHGVYISDSNFVGVRTDNSTEFDFEVSPGAELAVDGNSVNSIRFINDIWVAVGANGLIATSPDGATWTQRTSNTVVNLTDVAFGSGSYAAVGDSATVVTSTDLSTWTVNAGADSDLEQNDVHAIDYSGSSFAVVTDNGGVYTTSGPESTWTQRVSSFGTTHIFDIVYSDDESEYVAVGDSGKLATSTNGFTWVQRTSSFGTDPIYSVEFGGGNWIAGGANGKVAFSTDGVSWAQQTSGLSDSVVDVAYGDGKFVAVSGTSISVSYDGTNWTAQDSVSTENILSVEYDAGRWYLGTENGGVFASKDPAQNRLSFNQSNVVTDSDLDTLRGALNSVVDKFVDGTLQISHTQVDFTNLPTSDPSVAGLLWRDSDVVKVSLG